MRPNARAFRVLGSIAGLLLVALAAGSPSVARAQQRHGGQITKDCRDPRGLKTPRPGETVTCQITVTNADTFGDRLRIDRIVDTIQRAAGPQVNTIPLPLNLPPDLRGTCVGGTRAGLDCGCPAGTCGSGTPALCTGGSRPGLQCDCPGGTCTTILPGRGQQVVVVDTYIADAGVMGALTDDVIADGADLGLGNPTVLCQNSQPTPACFRLEIGDRLTVVTTTTSTTTTTTTTTTTIPACAASAPACNATCPPGQVCSPTAGGCVRQ